MDYNILEIVGMGTQEIKHSNILSWMFGDNEHKLGDQILLNFLAKIAEKNKGSNEAQILKEYIFLSKNDKNINIYRERDNIDLLIIDESNRFVIVIENKLYHVESNGQLKKYESIIENKYENYRQIYIFLTIDFDEPSEERWLKANFEMLVEVLQNFVALGNVMEQTKLILLSYIDLLKRRGIVSDKKLSKLCEQIWSKKEYREALEILINNKPSNYERISDFIKEKLEVEVGVPKDKIELYANNYNDLLFKTHSISDELYDNNEIFYNLTFDESKITLAIYINKDKYDDLYETLFPNKSKRSHRTQLKKIENDDWADYINDINYKNLETALESNLSEVLEAVKSTDKVLAEYL